MSQKYILITRPEAEATLLQKKLEKEGLNTLIHPLLSIRPVDFEYDVTAIKKSDGIIVTSKHTIPYLPKTLIKDNIPIYAIGKETAKLLKKNGFSVSATADGNSASLCKILSNVTSNESFFFHFGGVDTSIAFKENILKNFTVTQISVYKAEAVTDLSDTLLNALKRQQISDALFFSSRSAKIFENLCETSGVTQNLNDIQALCLAPSVVKSLDKRKWKAIDCAEAPDSPAMIAKLKHAQ